MSKKLIALVATAVMVAGVRTVIQPGEELPDLSKHDERELQGSGAAKHPEDVAAEAQAAARADKGTQQEFQDARQRAVEAQASTAVDLKTAAASASAESAVTTSATSAPAPAPAKPAAKTAKR